jgi:gliding motility-associated-like protein
VFVTDANGCTDTQSVSITEPPALTLTQTQVNICCNGSCNGSAGVTPAGGTAPYTYAWMPGSQTTSTVTGLCAGNYTCTVTDANGCSQVISCTITQPPVFASAASASTPAFCPGGCTNLNGSASGGILPYTYSWVPGNMTTSTVNVCPTATTTYTLFASDSGGCCISNVQVTVTVTQISIAASSTPSACASGTGTATATPSNGTSPYTYSWNNGQTSATATGLSPGTYTVTVTDANGCTQTQTVSVVVSGGPTAAASASNTTISPGDNTQLTASGGSTYSWYPSAGLSCTSCASPVATPAQTTTYCVLVTDANGCSDSACITISVEAPCLLESLNTLLPNAFSPNNDANNDQYCVPANVCIVSFTLKVYDRWGAKVFETSDMSTCWDGTYKGRPLNTDVFVYYFDALLSSGEEWHQKGNISLVK